MSFPALKADVLGATVEVKDAKGTVYAVKATDLSEGDKVATFEFEKAVDEKLFTGVWTVDGVEYDFDLINKITDIVEHEGQLDLNDALEAAEIKNVDTNLMGKYSDAIKAAETTPTTLEEIQAIVDKVNADNVSASEKEKIVEAVAAAGTNELKLYNALSANFERVNKDWIADYAAVNSEDGILFEKTESNIDSENAEDLFDAVQEAIDEANLVQVATVFAGAEHGLDAEKIAEAQKLVAAYKVPVEEGQKDIYAFLADTLTYQSAIVTANTASTNSALLTALTKVDSLLKEYTEKYDGKSFTAGGATVDGFKGGEDSFDLTQVRTDAASLKAYRDAIKAETVVGNKNQAKDLQVLIEAANTTADNTAKATAVDNLNSITASTTNAKVLEYLKAAQALDATSTNKINDAYAEAYKAEIIDFLSTVTPDTDDADDATQTFAEVTEVNTLVGTVNDEEDEKALLAAVNKATTAADMVKALLNLEDAEEETAFSDLTATQRAEVAQVVINTRNLITTGTAKQFATTEAALTAVFGNGEDVTGAIADYKEFINTINGSAATAPTASAIKAAFAEATTLVPEYAELDAAGKTEAADKVVDKLNALKEAAGDKAATTGFKTVAEIKEAAGL